MIVIKTLIHIDKMHNHSYIDEQVLASYTNCGIDSPSKRYILAFMSTNIYTYINNNCVNHKDEMFVDMRFPGFALKLATEFISI